MNLLVFGSTGLLGRQLLTAAPMAIGTARASGAIRQRMRQFDALQDNPLDLLLEIRPDAVINAVAYTSVDAAEDDRAAAFAINAEFPGTLAAACRTAGVRLIHISTDSVFGTGVGPFDEDANVAPLNVYADSKQRGETLVLQNLPTATVARVNFVTWDKSGRGLAEWAAREFRQGKTIRGFTDVVFNPLSGSQLASALVRLADHRHAGLLHLGCAGQISKFEFLQQLALGLGYEQSRVEPVVVGSTNFVAQRPNNTVLNTRRMADLLGAPPTVSEVVQSLVDEYPY